MRLLMLLLLSFPAFAVEVVLENDYVRVVRGTASASSSS